MEKEFVPYEECIALLGLNFNEKCGAFYRMRDTEFHLKFTEWNTSNQDHYDEGEKILCCAPTFSQAFRWFRKKGYRFNVVNDSSEVDGDYYYDVWFNGKFLFESHYIYKTYEEAELACLKELIKIVKNK